MEEYKQIGLNIWGIRGGFESFCHTDNLDVKTPEIANTWDNIDIREIVNVSNLNVRFYALEFTSNYKVFTIYRPEYDAARRPGACMATTLYVPHALRINNILDLLKQISDAYHKDHYDAFGNPNNAPDYIQVYFEIVKNFAGNIVREEVVRPWGASAQNNMPCLLPFSSLDVVAKFFATPYRNEFKLHQEVMFWDVTHVQNPQLFGVKFLKTEIPSFKTDGEGIGEQFEGGRILNDPPAGLSIASFRREGTDITANWRSALFYDNTMIEVELRKPYHHPVKYSGAMAGFSGNPFTKQGTDYRFGNVVSCQPYDYQIVLRAPEAESQPFELLVGNKSVSMSGGKGIFCFNGSEVGNPCEVSLKHGDNRFKVGDIKLSAFFKDGTETPDAVQEWSIDGLKTFRFRFNNDCAGQLCIAYKNPISFKTTGKEYAIVLPAATKLAEMSFKVEGYDADLKIEGDSTASLTLIPNAFNAEVKVSDDLKRFLTSSCFLLKIDGETYRTAIGGFVFAGLPKKTKEALHSTAKMGLSINGATPVSCRYTVEDNNDNIRLQPELMLVNNEADEKAEACIANITISVERGKQCVMPLSTGSNWLRNASAFQVMQPEKMSGYYLLTLKKKTTGVSVPNNGTQSSNQGSITGCQGGNRTGNMAAANRKVLGFYRFEGTERKLYEDECTRMAEGVYAFRLKGKSCTLCFTNQLPDTEKQKRQDDNNKDNGFSVRLGKTSAKVFEVEALPEKNQPSTGNGGNTGDGKRRWWLFGGIGLGALLLVGGFFLLGKGLGFGKSEKKTLSFVGNHGSNIEVKLTGCFPKKSSRKSKEKMTLKKNCDSIKVQIICDNEGEKDTTIVVKKLEFDENNHSTIKVNTQAWDSVAALDNKNKNSIVFMKDWKELYENYPSDSIKKHCASKAFEILKQESTNEQIEKYKNLFPECFTEEIVKMEKDSSRLIIEGFKTALDMVWSLDCNQNWIDSLAYYNEKLNGLPGYGPNSTKKNELCYEITKDNLNARDNETDMVKTVISNQKKFFKSVQTPKEARNLSTLANQYGFSGRQKDDIKAINDEMKNRPYGVDVKKETTYNDILKQLGIELANTTKRTIKQQKL